jgi:hypothetical protein
MFKRASLCGFRLHKNYRSKASTDVNTTQHIVKITEIIG